jgi:hypothetical protein
MDIVPQARHYLYKTMTVAIRSEGGVVLNVASSGIIALLFERGIWSRVWSGRGGSHDVVSC